MRIIIIILCIVMISSCGFQHKTSFDLEEALALETQAKSMLPQKAVQKDVAHYLDSVSVNSSSVDMKLFCEILQLNFDKQASEVSKLASYIELEKKAGLSDVHPYNKFKLKRAIALILLRDGSTYAGLNQMLLAIEELAGESEKYLDIIAKAYSVLGSIKELDIEEKGLYTEKYLEHAKRSKQIATANYNLGYFAVERKDYKQAMKHLRTSIATSLEIEGDYTNVFSSYQTDVLNFNWANAYPLIIDCFSYQNKIDSIYILIKRAADLYDNNQLDESSYNSFLIHTQASLVRIKDYKLASQYFDILLSEIKPDCANAYRMVEVYRAKSKLHEALGQTEASLESQKKVLYFASQCGRTHVYFKQGELDAINALIDMYERSGSSKDKQAQALQKRKIDLLESRLASEKKQNDATKFWSSFEVEVEKNGKKYQLEAVQSQKRRVVFLLLVCLIFLGSSMYIYRLNLLLKSSYVKINEKQNEVQLANIELTKSKEIVLRQNELLEAQKVEIESELKEKLLSLGFISNETKNIIKFIDTSEDTNAKLKSSVKRKLEDLTESNLFRNVNIQFQERYSDFVQKLCEKHPNLTANNIKFCILLMLNMSTKEIALIEAKSLESIKVARSRLRKKLDIKDTSISAYLNQLMLSA